MSRQTSHKTLLHEQARVRLRQFSNSLALKRPKFARTVHCCALCTGPIEKGTEFRTAGKGRSAHEFCFQVLARELK